jgi:F420-dependent oxidoreductase-like protein
MKIGLALDVWASPTVEVPVERVRRAEALGFDSVWSSEAYGADALTPLAYLAACTERIRLATSVVQISARTPAATAMAFATIDAMAGRGRVVAGIGLSGPQVVEGWYGTPWADPLGRTRDTVEIMRKIFRREGPVEHGGRAIRLPYDGPGATGEGKPLKPILHPNPDIPIVLAAGGPANVRLTAQLADGWLTMGFVPSTGRAMLDEFVAAATRAGRDPGGLETWSSVSVRITDDVAGAIAAMKPRTAMYVGGMGSREHNFHRDTMARRGYKDVADRIQELFLAGRREEAVDAVPDEYLDDGALLGSPARIAERWKAWADSGIGGVIVHPAGDDELEIVAAVADLEPGRG